MFLNSTHYPYFFEKEFEKFTPFQSKDFSFLTKISDPKKKKAIKNRYMNSVAYMDSIFGEIIEVFKSDIANQNLAVVFTSDHGEEFWEYGKLGHGKYFNNSRSVVPFKMKLPGVKNTTVKLSGASSIFPTIIDYLQPENRESVMAFMNGSSLLQEMPESDYFITGSSTFPFHDNRIELTGLSGSILARKSGNSMTTESTFSIISRKSADGSDLPESEFKNVDAYLTDYAKNYMKFVKIKSKK
jgi:membrane-anchored protein YejM (alkaline phosphatase superfamily)